MDLTGGIPTPREYANIAEKKLFYLSVFAPGEQSSSEKDIVLEL